MCNSMHELEKRKGERRRKKELPGLGIFGQRLVYLDTLPAMSTS